MYTSKVALPERPQITTRRVCVTAAPHTPEIASKTKRPSDISSHQRLTTQSKPNFTIPLTSSAYDATVHSRDGANSESGTRGLKNIKYSIGILSVKQRKTLYHRFIMLKQMKRFIGGGLVLVRVKQGGHSAVNYAAKLAVSL